MQSCLKRLAMIGISLIYAVIHRLWRGIARAAGGVPPPAPPVVMTYHGVLTEDIPRFEEQMRHLCRNATTVFADEARGANDRPRVAVTVDDAFQSVFDHALPVMARHGIPATIFAPTGFLGSAAGWMLRADGAAYAPAVASADVLASADRRQVKVASHTVTHPYLSLLQPSDVRHELAASKRTLEEISGEPVRMLSLPYGSCTSSVLEEARAAGYEQVFANVPVGRGKPSLAGLVGRINVTPRDWPLEFRLKARGAYDWLALAIPAKRVALALVRRNITP